MTQIEEGASCDVFFSAAAKQMDQLEERESLVGGNPPQYRKQSGLRCNL